MTVMAICIALLGLLVFLLGLGVSLARRRGKTGVGYPDDPADPLHKLVRAHGNTIEYAPMLALLIWVAGTATSAAWLQWIMIGATASRYMIVAGMLLAPSLRHPHPLRFLGALGTYVFGTVLCLDLLYRALA